MEHKNLKRSRMWKYFVEATAEIIEEEGIKQVTIRKVADRAGYNSATIYNYFSELSHLVFFASMKSLKSYTDDVSLYVSKGKNPYEEYILAWLCFCKHSFQHPDLFHAIFIQNLGEQPEKLLEHYYAIYPADLVNVPEQFQSILFERSMTKRGKPFLISAANEGLIKRENIDDVNEMTTLIWQGMLTNMLNHRANYDHHSAIEMTMQYITKIVDTALTKDTLHFDFKQAIDIQKFF